MLGVSRSQVPQVPSHWAVKRAFWWLRCQKVAVFFLPKRSEQAKKAKKRQKSGLPPRHCGGALRQHLICKYAPDYYKEHYEGGGIGGSFSGTAEPIVPLPMVVSYGRLGGRWFDSAGRFVFFCFFWQICFFGGRSAPSGSGLGWIRKSARWVPTPRSGWGTSTPKAALLARETARFACEVWALGDVFLGVRAGSSRRT